MITLAHGAGGRLSRQLVEERFLPRFDNRVLARMNDAALLGEIALTTDAHVVTPRFFPGGDLGRLAVAGTVNDLVVTGAEPIGLAAAFILEEGLPLEELDRLVASMAETAREANVPIVAGDTKVVQRGAADGVFITTSGIGRRSGGFRPEPERATGGDAVIVSGTLADHGMAVMALREGLKLRSEIRSDVAPLGGLVEALRTAGIDVHAMRDPTRGGVAAALNEIAVQAGVEIVLDQDRVPLAREVAAACELLGIDPLHVANEGRFIALVPAREAERALALLRKTAVAADARDIGEVRPGAGEVRARTAVGTERPLDMLTGEQLPRIC